MEHLVLLRQDRLSSSGDARSRGWWYDPAPGMPSSSSRDNILQERLSPHCRPEPSSSCSSLMMEPVPWDHDEGDPFLLPSIQEVTKDEYYGQIRKSRHDEFSHRPLVELEPIAASDHHERINIAKGTSVVPAKKNPLNLKRVSTQEGSPKSLRPLLETNRSTAPRSSSITAACNAMKSSPTPDDEGAPVLLPKEFAPGPWSVIIGRDKASLQAPGNKRLHMVVGWYLERYGKCRIKDEKTLIISEIESTIRHAVGSHGDGGVKKQGSPPTSHQEDPEEPAFIKCHKGRWWVVNSCVAREKIGRMLREALHTKYTSSSRSKRRRAADQKAAENKSVTTSRPRV